MANQASTGIRFKIFSGDTADYETWEDSFISNIRLQNLHYCFDQYAEARPKDFDCTSATQNVYDYLVNCLAKNSRGIVRRGAKDNGVETIKLLKKHY